MSNEPTTTVVGNLTGDPELRFTPSGSAVANFTVASTPRTFNRQTNEWDDGETWFVRCSIWREAAENVAESLTKGMRVVVFGRLKSRSFQTKEGENRTVIELEADEVAPSLRYATAKVERTARPGGGGAQQSAPAARPAARQTPAATNPGPGGYADPWATGPAAGGYAAGSTDEPPF